MLVRSLLEDKNRDVITGRVDMTIEQAMDVMIENKIGSLPIVDDDHKLTGIVSDKDIFQRIHDSTGDFKKEKLGDFMTTDLVVGVPDDELSYVTKIMDKNWIRHLPIIDGDELVGLVSQRDIIRTQAANVDAENRYLKLYTNAMGSRDKSSD